MYYILLSNKLVYVRRLTFISCMNYAFDMPSSVTHWLILYTHNFVANPTISSAGAETAGVTIRSVIANVVDRLTLTVTLNLTYVNFISLI